MRLRLLFVFLVLTFLTVLPAVAAQAGQAQAPAQAPASSQAQKPAEQDEPATETGKKPKPIRKTDDLKGLMQAILDAWSTLDPENAAPFYAKDADLVFYDITPLKLTGWAAYAEGVKQLLGNYNSLKLTLEEAANPHHRFGYGWATATFKADGVRKDGTRESFEGRWTVLFEKRNGEWLIYHEHVSVPPSPTVPQGTAIAKSGR